MTLSEFIYWVFIVAAVMPTSLMTMAYAFVVFIKVLSDN